MDLVRTVNEKLDEENIIAAFNGTFFTSACRAVGHIVNSGRDETNYNEIFSLGDDIVNGKNYGPKSDYVKKRSFIGLGKKGPFIGESDYEKGSILRNNPDLSWALGGLAKLKQNDIAIDTDALENGRGDTHGEGPGFQENSQLRYGRHMMAGVKNKDLYFFMNKTPYYIKNGNSLFNFINEFGFTDVVKLDGGKSTQMYLNNNHSFEGDRYIPNMVIIRKPSN